MYIGTHNIKNNPDIPRADVVRCGQIIRQKCVIAGLQEIGEGEDVEDVMTGLGSGWDIINESTPCPIVFNTSVVRLANARELPPGFQHRGITQFHKGDSSIPTPSRFATWGIFKSIMKPTVLPFVVSDGHLINKAWNERERDQRVLDQRQGLWWQGYDLWQWQINNFRHAGLDVIWMGDFNRRLSGIPAFNYAQRSVATFGIDHIFAAGKSIHVRKNMAKKINTPSDHPLVLGNVNLLVP